MIFIFGVFSKDPRREANRLAVDAILRARSAKKGDVVEIDDHLTVGWEGESARHEVLAQSGTHHVFGDITLYNRSVLGASLRAKGAEDPQLTDIEATCRIAKEQPGQFPNILNGDFSGVYYISSSKKIYLFRDHFGIKTLCYLRDKNTIFFASKAKRLLAVSNANTKFRMNSLASYLIAGTPTLHYTFYEGIDAVMPATIVEFNGVSPRSRRYWKPENTEVIRNVASPTMIEKFRERLVHAIASRIPSIGNVGVALSGGLDSATIAAVACLRAPDRKISSFTLGLQPGYIGAQTDERHYVEALAGHYPNLATHYINSVDRDPFAKLCNCVSWQGGPCCDGTAGGYDDLERAIRSEKIDVLLHGLGGDAFCSAHGSSYLVETLLHANFGRFWRELARRGTRQREVLKLLQDNVIKALIPWSLLRLRRLTTGCDPLRHYALRSDYVRKSDLDKEIIASGWEAKSKRHLSIRAEQLNAINFYIQHGGCAFDTLASEDCNVSHRFPLLDKDLIEACLSIPSHLKVSATHDRALIRATMHKLVPDVILQRRDKGMMYLCFKELLRAHEPRLRSEFLRFQKNSTWNELVDVSRVEEGFQVLARNETAIINDSADIVEVSLKLWLPLMLGMFLCSPEHEPCG